MAEAKRSSKPSLSYHNKTVFHHKFAPQQSSLSFDGCKIKIYNASSEPVSNAEFGNLLLVTVQGFFLSCSASPPFTKLCPKPIGSREKPLVPFIALPLTRKCHPVLIKLITLQHPHCGRHRLQANSSFLFLVTE